MAAVIDLLIKGGCDQEEVTQVVMRRILAAGVPPPRQPATRGLEAAARLARRS
jgi:hypothetical protein